MIAFAFGLLFFLGFMLGNAFGYSKGYVHGMKFVNDEYSKSLEKVKAKFL